MKKKIILVGGYMKAKSIAQYLLDLDYDVTIINKEYENCLKLAEICNVTVIKGDGTKPFVLEDADAESADIVIALTQCDCDNLVICELCKKKFHVNKTVSLINDPKKTEFFYKMGVDSVVCASNAITGIITQQALIDELTTMIPIGEGNINICEVQILGSSPVVEKKLWEIDLPQDVIVGCILRGDNSMIPRGDTRILQGDTLVLITSSKQQISAIRELTGR